MNVSTLPQRLKMALLSDVSLGYGTSQLLHMAESFARVFEAEVHIFEPDEPERAPIDIRSHIKMPDVYLTRLYTAGHPYSMHGRIEYCSQLEAHIRALNPQILLFSTMYSIPILDRINAGSKLKIFYCLEDINANNDYLFPLVGECDIRLFPEENRRRLYVERFGLAGDGKPSLLLYNSNNRNEWLDPSSRRERLFYGGSFDCRKNFASYFLEPDILKLPIDIYGVVRGFSDDKAVVQQLHSNANNARYCGYRQSDDKFFEMLSGYLYSIVIWDPEREDYLYACPNKFFDAIGCGIPPIAAPHPQCVEIINKWNCGLLMDDWSFESFRRTLQRALKTAGSDFYQELAFNCRRAMAEELSWERQFEKLIPFVKRYLSRIEAA